MKPSSSWVVGVDEAGRGALAGPVAVGAVRVPRNFDWSVVSGVRDSKQLTPRKREEIFEQVTELQKRKTLRYAVSMTSAGVIDRVGITRAVALATARALTRLRLTSSNTFIKLDGLLYAPERYRQETFVRGDQTEKEIALASICAKVMRDRLMCRMSEKYQEYSFEVHKGYGTELHRKAIQNNGPSAIHRLCFKGVVEMRQ